MDTLCVADRPPTRPHERSIPLRLLTTRVARQRTQTLGVQSSETLSPPRPSTPATTSGGVHTPTYPGCCWRTWRLHCSREGTLGKAACTCRWAERYTPRVLPKPCHWPKMATVTVAPRVRAT